MKKVINLILSIAVFFGITGIPSIAKADIIKKINQETPLILKHVADTSLIGDPLDAQLTWHWSHQSHQSHYSHSSHQSHYSHYSGY
ncbi:MAG: hypothetical protein HY755_01800 [Nitrospirae bacterium]|nr:hypothetical protein [Nitrospirota bacterium]